MERGVQGETGASERMSLALSSLVIREVWEVPPCMAGCL